MDPPAVDVDSPPEIVTEQVKPPPAGKQSPRGRKRGPAAKPPAAVDPAQAALVLCAIIEAVAALRYPDPAMLDHERALIADPLARIIARYAPLAGVAIFADPLAVIMGMSFYARRLRASAKPEQPPPPPGEPPAPTGPLNGGDVVARPVGTNPRIVLGP